MRQLMFSRCLRCGGTYQHVKSSGYGPLYCDSCRVEVRRANGKKRQKEYQQRKKAGR